MEDPKEFIEKAKKQLVDLTGFKDPAGIGFKKEKDKCTVIVEIVEKKSIPETMDIIGTYEVQLDSKGGLINYERIGLRKRIDTEASEKKEE